MVETGKQRYITIDPSTNSEFNVNFFQNIQFPINKVLFIFSLNDMSKISPILLDRMELIRIDNYTTDDKVSKSQKHLIPSITKDIIIIKDIVVTIPSSTLSQTTHMRQEFLSISNHFLIFF